MKRRPFTPLFGDDFPLQEVECECHRPPPALPPDVQFDANLAIQAMQRQALHLLQGVREPTGGCYVKGAMIAINACENDPRRDAFAQAVEILAWAGEPHKPPAYEAPVERLRKWAAARGGEVEVDPVTQYVILWLRKSPKISP